MKKCAGVPRVIFKAYKNYPAWNLANPGESHPEQRGHGSPRESRGERCEEKHPFL